MSRVGWQHWDYIVLLHSRLPIEMSNCKCRKSDKLLFHHYLTDQQLKRWWIVKIWRGIFQCNTFDSLLAKASIEPFSI